MKGFRMIEKKGWPKKGELCNVVWDFIRDKLKKVAHCRKHIFGFPQGCPTQFSVDVYNYVVPFQVNSIFGSNNSLVSVGINELESSAISAVIDLMGSDSNEYSGLITNGGTSANRLALQLGREFLLKKRNIDNEKIAIFCSVMAHYSIFQNCQTLGLDENEWETCSQCNLRHNFLENKDGSGVRLTGVDNKGAVLLKNLEEKIKDSYSKGVRRFIVIANAGTTLTGGVDDVLEISLLQGRLERQFSEAVYFYFHIDAAYGGMILPFMDKSPLRYLIGLKNKYRYLSVIGKEVDSLTVDPHKRYTPYSCGVSIFKSGLEDSLKMNVHYLGGLEMFSPDGSKQGAGVVAFWSNIFSLGYLGYEEKINKCLLKTDYFYSLLEGISGIEMVSKSLGVICVSFGDNIYFSKELQQKYFLCKSFFPKDPADLNSCMRLIYKFVVMDHWEELVMKKFIFELKKELKIIKGVL